MHICNRINKGAMTSEFEIMRAPLSFWHNNILNTNCNTIHKIDDRSLNPADLKPRSLSLYILMNKIIQKYALNPSQTNKGMDTVHHDQLTISSCLKKARTE